MRKTKILLSVFLLLVLPNFLYAQSPGEPVGNITFIEGVSDIVRNNQAPVVTVDKEPVYLNDQIRTKSYSKVAITFVDKSVLKLAPDSCVSIEEYIINAQKRREHSRIKLTRGRVEAVVSKTGTPDTFLIDTPNAQGAVKGSDIFVSYLGGKTGVFVLEGAISVFNSAVPGAKIKVTKDNCVVVPFSEAPGEIRPTRDAEIAYFKSGVEPAFIKKWIPSKGAAQMNGIIVSLTGSVRIYKKGADNWREPKINETISEGDKIQTEENSTIDIRMSNGNTIVLQPYTELSFTTLRYDSASGNYENTMAITKGRLSAVVERVKNQSSAFQVQTPTAVCGVRGTFMEVAVTPPPAVPPGASAPPPPATQVFFEGGSGYVTSTITNQTQEIGSGQNTIVDTLGNVSAPVETAPEQRSAMFQTWTSAQTMNNYSTADGATGVGSNTQQQSLPQPPAGAISPQLAGDAIAPLNEEIKNLITEVSNLELQGLTNEPVIQILYERNLTLDPEYPGTVGLTSGTAQIDILNNETWIAVVSGTWSGVENETVHGTFLHGSDLVSVSATGAPPMNGVEVQAWTGTISGSITSGNSPVSVEGNMVGTYSYTDATSGTFQGAGAGTTCPIPQ